MQGFAVKYTGDLLFSKYEKSILSVGAKWWDLQHKEATYNLLGEIAGAGIYDAIKEVFLFPTNNNAGNFIGLLGKCTVINSGAGTVVFTRKGYIPGSWIETNVKGGNSIGRKRGIIVSMSDVSNSHTNSGVIGNNPSVAGSGNAIALYTGNAYYLQDGSDFTGSSELCFRKNHKNGIYSVNRIDDDRVVISAQGAHKDYVHAISAVVGPYNYVIGTIPLAGTTMNNMTCNLAAFTEGLDKLAFLTFQQMLKRWLIATNRYSYN